MFPGDVAFENTDVGSVVDGFIVRSNLLDGGMISGLEEVMDGGVQMFFEIAAMHDVRVDSEEDSGIRHVYFGCFQGHTTHVNNILFEPIDQFIADGVVTEVGGNFDAECEVARAAVLVIVCKSGFGVVVRGREIVEGDGGVVDRGNDGVGMFEVNETDDLTNKGGCGVGCRVGNGQIDFCRERD